MRRDIVNVLQWAKAVGQTKIGTWGHGATWASAAPSKTKAAGQISRAERTARDRSCWCAEVSAGMCAQRANACMQLRRTVRTICPARLRASKAVAFLCRVGVLPAHIPGACSLSLSLRTKGEIKFNKHKLSLSPYAELPSLFYPLSRTYTHNHYLMFHVSHATNNLL